MDRNEIRTHSRTLRKRLSVDEQTTAARNLKKNVCVLPHYQLAQRLALYLSNDGEIDPRFIIEDVWNQGKQCYLPVMDAADKTKMHFQPYAPDTVLVKGRFGILEPELDEHLIISPEHLDLVFLPLTAFDKAGHRMGMGGGFYDRAFAFAKQSAHTVLIGLAHECQRFKALPIEEWDVPLQGVLTDQQYYS